MSFSGQMEGVGSSCGDLRVRLSNQLIHLLSEQMYSSPLKAIEELVVNAYDADANECRIALESDNDGMEDVIAIYDNGHGMDSTGLEELWYIGQSPKTSEDITPGLRSTRNRKIWHWKIGYICNSQQDYPHEPS